MRLADRIKAGVEGRENFLRWGGPLPPVGVPVQEHARQQARMLRGVATVAAAVRDQAGLVPWRGGELEQRLRDAEWPDGLEAPDKLPPLALQLYVGPGGTRGNRARILDRQKLGDPRLAVHVRRGHLPRGAFGVAIDRRARPGQGLLHRPYAGALDGRRRRTPCDIVSRLAKEILALRFHAAKLRVAHLYQTGVRQVWTQVWAHVLQMRAPWAVGLLGDEIFILSGGRLTAPVFLPAQYRA